MEKKQQEQQPKKKKKYKAKHIIIVALVLIIGLGLIFFVVKKISKEPEVAKKEKAESLTFVLQQESVSDELEFFGNLEANKESELSAKVAGRISSIKVEEGDEVKMGTLLAFLAPDQYGIDYNKKSTDFDNFEKYRKDQKSYWDREVKIAKENLRVKKSERDYYKDYEPSKLDIAEDSVDKAEAELRAAKRERDAQDKSLREQSDGLNSDKSTSAQYVADTRIRAPFCGVVTKKFLEDGEVVAAGEPVISVADISSYKVVVEVPDLLISKLSVGLGARVELDGISGEHSARVTSVKPKVDPSAKKIEVEVTLDAAPPQAKVDMFARVFIKFPPRTAFFVPNNFVYSGFTGPFVVIGDGTQQPVERLEEKDGSTEIAFKGITNGIEIKQSLYDDR